MPSLDTGASKSDSVPVSRNAHGLGRMGIASANIPSTCSLSWKSMGLACCISTCPSHTFESATHSSRKHSRRGPHTGAAHRRRTQGPFSDKVGLPWSPVKRIRERVFFGTVSTRRFRKGQESQGPSQKGPESVPGPSFETIRRRGLKAPAGQSWWRRPRPALKERR